MLLESIKKERGIELMLNTIVHSDSLSFLRTISTDSIDACITDPPYGIDYQSSRRTDRSKLKPKIANDKAPYIWFLKEIQRVLKPSGCLLCFTRYDTEFAFREAMRWGGALP